MKTYLFVFGLIFFSMTYAHPAMILAQPLLQQPLLADAASFVSDVTIPDGTVLKPGETFTKTWRIANQGSTTWTGYQLAFIGGDQLGGPPFVEVPKKSPEQTVDMSVGMTAPTKPGVYRSTWQMRTADGTVFGQNVYALIMVKEPTPPNSRAALGSRPILYLDIDGKEPVISAVSPDGASKLALVRSSEVGCIACTGGSTAIWSPDGRKLAFTALDVKTQESILYIQELDGKPKKIYSDKDLPLQYPAWSPNGKKIAIFSHGLKIVDVSDGTMEAHSLSDARNLIRPGGFMSHPNKIRWSPDGRHILISWGSTVVLDTARDRVQEITSHPVLAEWAPKGDGVYYFDILYKDDKAASPKDWGGFYYKKLDASEPVALMEGEKVKKALDLTLRDMSEATLWPGFMTLSPKETRLAVIIRKSDSKATIVYIYDLRSGSFITLDKPSKKIQFKGFISAMDWSPNDQAIAIAGVTETGLGIQVLDLETEALTALAVIPPDETIGAIYGFGLTTISWSQ